MKALAILAVIAATAWYVWIVDSGITFNGSAQRCTKESKP